MPTTPSTTDTTTPLETPESSKPAKKMKYEEVFTKRAYFYGVGRRKTSTAQVRVHIDGKGRLYVNKIEYRKYFPHFEIQKIVTKALDLLKEKQNLDISVQVKGGGFRGQAEAILLAISRALVKLNSEHREKLKHAGFLKTDARKKERKKPGLKRARRAPQWQKR